MPITDELQKEIEETVSSTEFTQGQGVMTPKEVSDGESASDSDEAGGDDSGDSQGGEAGEEGEEELGDGGHSGDEAGPEEDGDEGGDGPPGDAGPEGSGAGAGSKNEPTISTAAMTDALEAGLSVGEVLALETDEQVLSVAALVRSKREADERAVAETKAAEDHKQADDDLFADFPEFDPDETDPAVIKTVEVLKSIARRQQETIRSFEAQTASQTQVAEAAQLREMSQWFDGQVAAMGKDFEKVLGTGPGGQLAPDSNETKTRDAIADQMAITIAGCNATGRAAPSREEVFQDAARVVLKDQYEELRVVQQRSKENKRSAQEIQRVTGRNSRTKGDPLEEAAAALDKKYFSG